MVKDRTKNPAKRQTSESIFERLSSTGVRSATDPRNLALVFVVALGIRLVFFFLNRHNNPLFHYPIMDAKYHLEWAQEILSGNFWGDEVFFRAPLYPYFLALLYKLGGAKIGFVVLCQHVMGAFSAALVYGLARQFFRPAVGLLAGLTAALYWPFMYFEADLLIVTVIVCLDLAGLLCLAVALRHGRAGLFVAGGGLLGLSAIARPSLLIFFLVLPVVFFYQRTPADAARRTAGRTWIRRTVLVYAAAAVVITPVFIRNFVVGRDIVPIASQGGVNFFIGNNSEADGRTAIVPGTRWDWWGGYQDAIRIAETEAGRKLKPSEISSYYFRKGLDFILTSPGESIPLLAKKLYLFWAAGERSNNKYIYFFWHKSGMGRVPLPGFWFVGPLGLLGGVILWRRKRELSLLYLFVLSYMVGVVAFFVNARFRLPVVPVLTIFAAYALFHLWIAATRERAGLWKTLLVLAVCLFAVDFDLVRFGENDIQKDAMSHYTLGNAYLNRGDSENAIAEYEEALETYGKYRRPGFLLVARNVEYNLGRLFWSKKRCAKAIPHLERVGGNDKYAVLSLEMLGDCYLKENRFEDAVEAYTLILRAVPDHQKARPGLVQALLGMADTYTQNGDREKAIEYLERAASISPDDPSIDSRIDALRRGQ